MLALRDDGDPLPFWADAERTAAALERVDPADAGAYVAYDRHVRALSGFLARMNRTTPARLDKATPRDLVEGLKLGKAYRGLGARTARELTRALPMAVADFVREWFRDDAICGALAARGTLMTELGPWSAGSALVLLNDMAEGRRRRGRRDRARTRRPDRGSATPLPRPPGRRAPRCAPEPRSSG